MTEAAPRPPATRIRVAAAAVALMALTALLMASGCGVSAGAGRRLGKQTVKVNHYPTCYQPIADMRRNAEELNTFVYESSKASSLAALRNPPPQNRGDPLEDPFYDHREAIIRSEFGMRAGAGIAYVIINADLETAQSGRFSEYARSMAVNFKELNQAVTAARFSAECYSRELPKVEEDFLAGRIDEREKKSRASEIIAGTKEIATILRNYDASAEASVVSYAKASGSEIPQPRKREPVTRPSPPPKEEPAAAVQASAQDLGDRVTDIQNSRSEARALIELLEDTSRASEQVLKSVHTAEGGIILAQRPVTRLTGRI
jgi:hypothetical protein